LPKELVSGKLHIIKGFLSGSCLTSMLFINLEDYLNWASLEFSKANLHFGHGTDNAWDEAVHVAIYALNLPKDNSRDILKRELTEKQANLFTEVVNARLSTKKPLPYLVGYCWYANEKYLVTEDTLIPRSPIFEIILNGFKPFMRSAPENILDMCTGGGCLAIVAAKKFKDAKVLATDISIKALEVAMKNIELHKVANVTLLASDLFNNVGQQLFDTIISNPPYVSSGEMKTLPIEYTYEPKLALESVDNGLGIPKQIMSQAMNYLSENGILVLEVGNSYYELEKLDKKIKSFSVSPLVGGHGIYVFPKKDLRAINERINKRIDKRV
jgi:ribosomal protein L3 glutamine methyltransferase